MDVLTGLGQREPREGETRFIRESERFIVAMKSAKVGGAKEPWFSDNVTWSKRPGEGDWR